MTPVRQGEVVFPTAIGACRVAWRADRITSVTLLSGRALDNRPATDHTPPRWVRDVQQRLTLHLDGTIQDLSTIPLDFSGIPPFHQQVYRMALAIPAGPSATANWRPVPDLRERPGRSARPCGGIRSR